MTEYQHSTAAVRMRKHDCINIFFCLNTGNPGFHSGGGYVPFPFSSPIPFPSPLSFPFPSPLLPFTVRPSLPFHYFPFPFLPTLLVGDSFPSSPLNWWIRYCLNMVQSIGRPTITFSGQTWTSIWNSAWAYFQLFSQYLLIFSFL